MEDIDPARHAGTGLAGPRVIKGVQLYDQWCFTRDAANVLPIRQAPLDTQSVRYRTTVDHVTGEILEALAAVHRGRAECLSPSVPLGDKPRDLRTVFWYVSSREPSQRSQSVPPTESARPVVPPLAITSGKARPSTPASGQPRQP